MNFNLFKLFSVVTLLFVTAVNAETKQARNNDVAQSYTLESNGDLFRKVGRNKCQITNNVSSFKVSQHSQDAAMIYFEKNQDLYVLHNAERTGNCPRASTKVIMSNVEKYNVVSNTNTTIVNVALSRSGNFVAWDNTRPVLTEYGVRDYTMYNLFGSFDAPFNSYVLFAINDSGYVLKVKGKSPGSSKYDQSKKYYDLRQFKSQNGIE